MQELYALIRVRQPPLYIISFRQFRNGRAYAVARPAGHLRYLDRRQRLPVSEAKQACSLGAVEPLFYANTPINLVHQPVGQKADPVAYCYVIV